MKGYIIILLLLSNILKAQYSNYSVKEEYDLFNEQEVNNSYNPCLLPANNDQGSFGDGLFPILESYVTMFKTTKDKAYLYKFVKEAICVIENRHDFTPPIINPDDPSKNLPNGEPRWATSMYHDGNIVAALSRFVYLIKIEEPSLFYAPIYQFDELNPANYVPNTCNCNKFGITFTTFGQFANWLQDRVGETAYWFIYNGYWQPFSGMEIFPNQNYPAHINQQSGFARMFLFNGLTAGNNDFLFRSSLISVRSKGQLNLYDFCHSPNTFNDNVFILNQAKNSYWWYHAGYRVAPPNCLFANADLSKYFEFYEDISHGVFVNTMIKDMYDFLPGSNITHTDMVRFHNTFTQNIYDGNGGFYNTVNGQNNPVSNNTCSSQGNCPHNFYKDRATSYMQLAKYDNAAGASGSIYNIVMDYYLADIYGKQTSPYSGLDNRGHAYVVAEQWRRECTNLTLYNRKMVYNQDFFAKNDLTILPGGRNGFTYADPKNTNATSPDYFVADEFRIEPNVTVNMQAGNRIEINPGFTAEQGSNFIAEINPSLCNSSGARKVTPNNNQNENNRNNIGMIEEIEEEPLRIIEEQNMMMVAPNPIKGKAVISFSIITDANITLQIFDIYGRLISTEIPQQAFQKGMHQVIFNTNKYDVGIYLCKLYINNEVLTQKIVKQ